MNRERALRIEDAARFVVARVLINEVHDQQVVTLQEAGGVRMFAIIIGIYEATTLDRAIKRFPVPRPMTHDAWAATIRALGGEVQDVLLTDMRDGIYYASLRIRPRIPGQAWSEAIQKRAGPRPVVPARLIEVDMRPSDAFVLAVQLDVPIFVKDTVWERLNAANTAYREGQTQG
jgi:bifunctional DNase/RNase